MLRDSAVAREAKALLGRSFRENWGAKQRADGYESGSGTDDTSPKARMARTMQHFVDHFEETPVVVLPCHVRYRDPNQYEGASVYPACQNLLLAARALGYGGVMTIWHAFVEPELRPLLGIPDDVVIAATIPLGTPAGHHGPVRRRPIAELVFEDGWDRPRAVGRRPRRHEVHRRRPAEVGLTAVRRAADPAASVPPAAGGWPGASAVAGTGLGGHQPVGEQLGAAAVDPEQDDASGDHEGATDHAVDAVVADLAAQLVLDLRDPVPDRVHAAVAHRLLVLDALVEVVFVVGDVLAERLDALEIALVEQVDDVRPDVGEADADAVEGVTVTEVGGDGVHEPDGGRDGAQPDERHAHRAHPVQVHGTHP